MLEAGGATLADVATQLAASLDSDPADVPFAGIYLREGGVLRLRASTSAPAPLPDLVDLTAVRGPDDWGLRVAAGGRGTTVPVPTGAALTGGAFGHPVTQAVAMPLPGGDPQQPLGVVVVDSNSGMETQTMITLGDTAYTLSREVMVHEMVHQWQDESGHTIDHGATFRAKCRELGIAPYARRVLATRPGRSEGSQTLGRRAARDG